MKLISLLEKLEYTCLQGSTDQEVKNVIYDSRKVEEGSLFICIRGAAAKVKQSKTQIKAG